MDPLVEAHMEARALPHQQNFFQAQVQDLTKECSNHQGVHNCKIDPGIVIYRKMNNIGNVYFKKVFKQKYYMETNKSSILFLSDTTPEEAFFSADMTTAHLMHFRNIWLTLIISR